MQLRRISTKINAWKLFAFLLFIIFIIVFSKYENIKNSFLKYADKNVYKPKNDKVNVKGLIGKINAYLQIALDSVNENATDVFHRYPRISLTYPLDSSEFATYGDVRLTDYIPVTEEEKDFFYNSQFRKLILQQQKDLSEEFFKISFADNHSRINSIVVDEAKLLTILVNESWEGSITFKDPTLDWDSTRKFIVCEGTIIPLFSTPDSTLLRQVTIPLEGNNLTPEEIINSFWNENHGLSITVQETLNFRIIQIDTIIRIISSDSTFQIENEGKLFGSRINLSSRINGKNIFIKFRKDNIEIPLSITTKSPFEMGSQVANGTFAGNTIDIDESYSDLFSRQILRSLRLALSGSDTSKFLNLAYDALQSKYYENIFKDSLFHNLQNNFGDTADTNYDINLTLVDIGTGEIIAAPYYNNSFSKLTEEELMFKKNYNLKSSYEIGSTFKPILAGACVLNYPSLLNYRFDESHYRAVNIPDKIYNVNGFNIRWTMKTPSEYFYTCNSLGEFLARSHDGYPIGLTMNCLIGNRDGEIYNSLLRMETPPNNLNSAIQFLRHNGSNLTIATVQNTFLCKTLDYVFGIPIDKKPESTSYFPSFKQVETPSELLPEPSSLFGMDVNQLTSFRNLDYNSELRSWILGQGMLDISLFKLSQAYARLLTKKKINLSYMPQPFCNDLIYSDRMLPGHMAFENGMNINEKKHVWDNYLTTWSAAQSNTNATFNKVSVSRGWGNNYNKFRTALNSFSAGSPLRNLQVYFKTGTPSNDTTFTAFKNVIQPHDGYRLGKDDAFFVMAITNPNDSIRADNTKGIVMIAHVSRRKICRTDEEAKRFKAISGLWGADLINKFLTVDVIRNIIRYNQSRF